MPPVSSPERPVAQRAAYSARPTVLVDGQRSEPVMQMLRSCVVREAEGGLSSLSLTLSNWGNVQGSIGYLFNDGALIDFGTRLKLYFGETSAPRAVFEGEVHAIEAHAPMGAPPEITFLAEDKLFAARQARRSALYADMTPADVVQRIASQLGLQPDIDGLDAGSGTWAQLNESDLAFLRRLLARFDADLQLSGDALQVRRSAERERGTINLSMYSQLQQLRVIADLADQVTEVTASGFDVAAGSTLQRQQPRRDARHRCRRQRQQRVAAAASSAASTWHRWPAATRPRRRRWPMPPSTSARAASCARTAAPKAMPSCAWAAPCASTASARASATAMRWSRPRTATT